MTFSIVSTLVEHGTFFWKALHSLSWASITFFKLYFKYIYTLVFNERFAFYHDWVLVTNWTTGISSLLADELLFSKALPVLCFAIVQDATVTFVISAWVALGPYWSIRSVHWASIQECPTVVLLSAKEKLYLKDGWVFKLPNHFFLLNMWCNQSCWRLTYKIMLLKHLKNTTLLLKKIGQERSKLATNQHSQVIYSNPSTGLLGLLFGKECKIFPVNAWGQMGSRNFSTSCLSIKPRLFLIAEKEAGVSVRFPALKAITSVFSWI